METLKKFNKYVISETCMISIMREIHGTEDNVGGNFSSEETVDRLFFFSNLLSTFSEISESEYVIR